MFGEDMGYQTKMNHTHVSDNTKNCLGILGIGLGIGILS